MEDAEFLDKVLKPMLTRNVNVFAPSLFSAYRDLTNVVALDAGLAAGAYDPALAQQIGGHSFPLPPDLGKQASEELRLLLDRQDKRATLLKAAYEFANIFVDATLKEVCQNSQLTLKRYLGSPTTPHNFTHPTILSTYCVVTYRHKIVSHLERHRLVGNTGIGGFRLTPSSPTEMSAADRTSIETLQRRYDTTIPSLGSSRNPREALEVLFERMPLNSAASVGPACRDRIQVDELVERNGCPSKTMPDIVQAIDAFATEAAL
jgi:hypothetical protein